MNLVIDIGNTRIKAAIFDSDKLIHQITCNYGQEESLIRFLDYHKSFTACIISAVKDIPVMLLDHLIKSGKDPLILDSMTAVPFNIHYQSRETLGNDRIAAVAGAFHLHPKQNVLIINAGTAITYDVKTANEEYPGGNISPGMTMRFKALHEYTARLPLLSPGSVADIIGNNTNEAILNGVQNGILAEIEGTIHSISNKYPGLIVILTGGDAQFFADKLKKTIFVVSNLTLIGLNIILEYNAKLQ